MKIEALTQGTPEWHAHRAAHLNASDAPAMLGCSPYKTREQLVREFATGIAEDHDAATQKRFEDGHRFEGLARPLAEKIIGSELYPCIGTLGPYSASFDGLTLEGDTILEHKSWSLELAAKMENGDMQDGRALPEHYRVQMEHQLMVAGAERVLFMASKWGDDGLLIKEFHCWYTGNPELRSRIIFGWKQFATSAAAYESAPVAMALPVGRAPDQLPALRIELNGMVTTSNLAEFKDAAIAVFQSIGTDLETDQDFADAESTIKWCLEIEARLRNAKESALAQTTSIDALFRAIDSINDEARAKRLELDRLVKARKEQIRENIVGSARQSVLAHLTAINATLGEHAIGIPMQVMSAIGGSIKGRKTLASITDAANSAAANAKIELSQHAERVRACMAILAEAQAPRHLFPDRVMLCATKEPADLRNLVSARIAEHEQAAKAKAEAERERARNQNQNQLRDQEHAGGATAAAALGPVMHETPVASGARIRLGEINERIAPLAISSEGLASLGFQPQSHQGAAKLYAADDLERMCEAMVDVLRRVRGNPT